MSLFGAELNECDVIKSALPGLWRAPCYHQLLKVGPFGAGRGESGDRKLCILNKEDMQQRVADRLNDALGAIPITYPLIPIP